MSKPSMEIVQFDPIELGSGIAVVSDPCYELDNYIDCMGVIRKVKEGLWIPTVMNAFMGEWGHRILEMTLTHKEHLDGPPLECLQCPFEVGVDSGQAGIFDLLAFHNDSLVERPLNDQLSEFHTPWYRACGAVTLSQKLAGTLPGGAVSSSGFGDGCYTAYVYLRPLEDSEQPQELTMREGLIEQGDLQLKVWDAPREIVSIRLDFAEAEEEEEDLWGEDY